ncbi:MAG TPA: hypothetical protein PLE45_05595 [Spirochaetota bacterium]|nr:hypothetical protein [Spirochaetota bacterium]HPP03637.1 hypothetical protein [Spirochaetota bacterium]
MLLVIIYTTIVLPYKLNERIIVPINHDEYKSFQKTYKKIIAILLGYPLS